MLYFLEFFYKDFFNLLLIVAPATFSSPSHAPTKTKNVPKVTEDRQRWI